MINFLFAGLLFFSLSACGDEEKNPERGTAETEAAAAEGVDEEAIKVNPAHGLPGHRCDLPVGAPLTNAATTPDPTPTAQLPSTSVSPIRVDQTPDVNPPHGEPGHRCDLPVGAELD